MAQEQPKERCTEIAISVALALFWGLFAADNWASLQENGFKLSVCLLTLKVTADVIFILIRRFPKTTSLSPFSWLVGFFGTISSFLFRPTAAIDSLTIGLIIQSLAFALQFLSVCSLNRSYGVIAANRGVKTRGMYRLIRHPLYSSYLVGQAGFLINNFSSWNLLVLISAATLQIARIFEEERILMGDESYQVYAASTRWRLVPGLF